MLAFPFVPCADKACSISSGLVWPAPVKTTAATPSPFVMSNQLYPGWPRASMQLGMRVLTKQTAIGLALPTMARSAGGGLASWATTSVHGDVVANDCVRSRYLMICAFLPCQTGSAATIACSTSGLGKGTTADFAGPGKTRLATI